MTIEDITKPDNMTLGQVKMIPEVVENWLKFDEDYTFDTYLDDEIKMFARRYANACCPEVIKIERLEWAGNWQGRINDYNSDITVWVTAIVDCGNDRILRMSFDLLDCNMMSDETGCSGLVHEPY